MAKLRIERVLEVKERFLDDKKKEMESITAALEQIIDEIYETDNVIEENYNKIISTSMNGNEMFMIKEYITYLENKKHDMFLKKEDLKLKINNIRNELVEMMKEIKMLEILKSKELQLLKKSQNRRVQKMLDEMASRVEDKR